MGSGGPRPIRSQFRTPNCRARQLDSKPEAKRAAVGPGLSWVQLGQVRGLSQPRLPHDASEELVTDLSVLDLESQYAVQSAAGQHLAAEKHLFAAMSALMFSINPICTSIFIIEFHSNFRLDTNFEYQP